MNEHGTRALQIETEFLGRIESNFESAKGRQLRGTIWHTTRHDESDSVRAMLASKRLFDRGLLKQLPANRRICIHGYERKWWFGRRKTGIAIASTLAPITSYVEGSEYPPPIGLAELNDHVRKLITDPKVPHVVGVCSPTGFTDEVRNAKLEFPNTVLVLAEPKPGGGWRIHPTSGDLPRSVIHMFDPEAVTEKMDRVRQAIEERSADLLTGGLSARSIATRLELPLPMVDRVLEDIARADPELRITRRDSELLVFRGAPVATGERTSMSVVDRLRQLLSGQADEATKINVLAERRAALAQRRDRMYDDIAKLEGREAELLDQGRATKSQVTRRRLAAQLAQLRKDIHRANSSAGMLNQQIDIISTDIHNLTLIKQGEMASLPNTEELTENAVKAEEMLETLRADVDLVSSLETGISDMTTPEDERAILAEFEEEPGANAEPYAAELAEFDKEPEKPSPQQAKEPPRRSADPEAS